MAAATSPPLEPTRFTLDNGMTFLVVERPGRPLVAAVWAARGGSASDPPGRRGLAHVVEHLLYAGSRTIGARDWDEEAPLLRRWERLYERSVRQGAAEPGLDGVEQRLAALQRPGAYAGVYTRAGALGIDAFTRHDSTAFQVLTPKEKIELWFWMESDRLLEPVFRGFRRELAVVEQERRQRIDSTPAGTWFDLFDAAYWGAGHPYAHSPGGERLEVARLLPADARSHFEATYRPDRLVAVLVGDLTAPRIRELAERYFGRLEGGRQSQPDARDSRPAAAEGARDPLGARVFRPAAAEGAREPLGARVFRPAAAEGARDPLGARVFRPAAAEGARDPLGARVFRPAAAEGGQERPGPRQRPAPEANEAPATPGPPEPALGSLEGLCACRGQVEIRYPTVPFAAAGDAVALDVLAGLLNGRSGRLYRELVAGEGRVAFAASAEHVSRRLGGYFAVRIEAGEGAVPSELAPAWDRLLERVRAGGVDDAELERVKRQLATDSWRQLEQDVGLAHRLAAAEALGGWRQLTEWLDAAAAVSAADLERAIDRYLLGAERAVLSLTRTGGP